MAATTRSAIDRQARPAVRRRRRGAALQDAIYEATWAELLEHGYEQLTVDGVAARAGTSKAVIYRRWPSRAALVIGTVTQHQPPSPPPVLTGDLRHDLLALLRHTARRFDGVVGEMLRGLMIDTLREPELGQLVGGLIEAAPTAAGIVALLDEATRRGEIDEDRLTPRVTALPLDLIRYELLGNGVPIRPRTLEEIVDQVLLPILRTNQPTTDPTT